MLPGLGKPTQALDEALSLPHTLYNCSAIQTGEALMEVQVIFYSMYGHVHQMAEAVVQGAQEVEDVRVGLYQVPELIPDEALERVGAQKTRQAFAQVPIAEPIQLAQADAIIYGTPTRYGNMCAQMRNFLDRTGQLWQADALVGKVGSVFVSTGTQHGGQETTITSFHSTLLHHGMIIVGLPYSEKRQLAMDQITGGSPYGATTIAAGDGSRQPSPNELDMARFQGRHVAKITKALLAGGWKSGSK
jgi:NAD(P)H:quinone oxidoreductase type IV